MKILSWNINRGYKNISLINYMDKYNADVICMQEITLHSILDKKLFGLYKYFNSDNHDIIVYSKIKFSKKTTFHYFLKDIRY